MNAKTAFAKLRDEAHCQMIPPANDYAGVATLLRQILRSTEKSLSDTELRTLVMAAACYYDSRGETVIEACTGEFKAAAQTAKETAEKAAQAAEETNSRLETAAQERNELKKSLSELRDMLNAMKESSEQGKNPSHKEGEILDENRNTHATPPTSNFAPRTYATATAQSIAAQILRPTHAATIARGDVSAKQIVLRLDPTQTEVGDTLADLTDSELVEKAQVALDLITGAGPRPEKMAFAVARRQTGGKVLLQLNSEAAARWLRNPETLREFEGHFGGSYLVKPHAFEIIAEFVPISLDLDDPELFRQAETINELNEQEIIGGRWLRAPERRSPGQKKAFVAIGCRTRAGANRLIQNGLLLDGRVLETRRTKPEPLRCAKCQRLNPNHVARTCTSPHDVCALCSGQHRTSECGKKDPETVRCANCHGPHAASDRNCPEFQKKVTHMRERMPDTAYVYFPTNEPWTWVKHEETAITVNHIPRMACDRPQLPRRTAKDSKQAVLAHNAMPPPFYASRANRIPLGRTQSQLSSWFNATPTDETEHNENPTFDNIHTILGQTSSSQTSL